MRSLIVTQPVQQKLNPLINLKKRDSVFNYHLLNDDGQLTQVCLWFFTRVLQINRKKVNRAVSSARNNPDAIDRRGSATQTSQNVQKMNYMRQFIAKFIPYENYLHPRLTQRKMYLLYQEDCVHKIRNMLSESTFRNVFRKEFHLKFFRRTKEKCECQKKNLVAGRYVLPLETIEEQKNQQSIHLQMVLGVKNNLIESVENAKLLTEQTEVLTFELQHAMELPYLSIETNEFFLRSSFGLIVFVCLMKFDRRVMCLFGLSQLLWAVQMRSRHVC